MKQPKKYVLVNTKTLKKMGVIHSLPHLVPKLNEQFKAEYGFRLERARQ